MPSAVFFNQRRLNNNFGQSIKQTRTDFIDVTKIRNVVLDLQPSPVPVVVKVRVLLQATLPNEINAFVFTKVSKGKNVRRVIENDELFRLLFATNSYSLVNATHLWGLITLARG